MRAVDIAEPVFIQDKHKSRGPVCFTFHTVRVAGAYQEVRPHTFPTCLILTRHMLTFNEQMLGFIRRFTADNTFLGGGRFGFRRGRRCCHLLFNNW